MCKVEGTGSPSSDNEMVISSFRATPDEFDGGISMGDRPHTMRSTTYKDVLCFCSLTMNECIRNELFVSFPGAAGG